MQMMLLFHRQWLWGVVRSVVLHSDGTSAQDKRPHGAAHRSWKGSRAKTGKRKTAAKGRHNWTT